MPDPEPIDLRTQVASPRTGVEFETGPWLPAGAGPRSGGLPARIGRFEVRDLLGEGAFGRVYRGFDPELQREVAIKVPHRKGLTAGFRERFLREARAAATIHHPNVCPVYEVGTEGDLPYIVMHFVPGPTLAALLDRRKTPFPPRQAAGVVRKLALGVDAAHARGIVHRDLKPQNVLVDEAQAEVLVTDFGVARIQGETRLTADGAILGTPAYMSPEQARGESTVVGPLSDVYSLGVILYRLLTGTVPFGGTVLEVMIQICETAPRPPSDVCQGLDPKLCDLCLKAMAKHPDDRFPSAKEFANALSDYLRRITASETILPSKDIASAPRSDSARSEESTLIEPAAPAPPQVYPLPAFAGAAADAVGQIRRSPFRKRNWLWPAIGVLGVVLATGIVWSVVAAFKSKPKSEEPQPPSSAGQVALALAPPDPRKTAASKFQARGGQLFAADVGLLPASGLTPSTKITNALVASGKYRNPYTSGTQWATGAVAVAFSDAGLDMFTDLPPPSNGIGLVGQNVTDRGIEKLVALPPLNGIGELWLMNCSLGDDSIRHAASLPNLKKLVLDGTNITDAGLKFLPGKLTVLTLRDTLVTDAGLPELAKHTKLTLLDLRGTGVTEAGSRRVQADLPGCEVVREDPNRAAAEWLFTRGVGSVTLRLPDGNEVKATEPAQIPPGAFLLDGIGTGIQWGDADLKRLEPLRSLRFINMTSTDPFTTTGLRSLLVHKATLRELANPPVTEEGLKVFGELTELNWLILEGLKVTDDGVKHLAGLTKLQKLQLRGTQVSDASIGLLAEMKMLTHLDLRGTKVSKAGVEKLADKLPLCKIESSGRGEQNGDK